MRSSTFGRTHVGFFVSSGNRDLLSTNPDRYAPQYGGYCALGLSAGEYANVDPIVVGYP